MKMIQTLHAPAAVGAYSQGVLTNNTLYVSGQIPFIPETMTLISQDIQEQTLQYLKTFWQSLKQLECRKKTSSNVQYL